VAAILDGVIDYLPGAMPPPAYAEFKAWIAAYPLYAVPGFQVLISLARVDALTVALYLVNLRLPPERRYEGHGSVILRKLIEIADRDGLPIILEASERTESAAWLQTWYTRHGFECTGDSGDYGPWMLRPSSALAFA
jgi:GNAT superfamily N-acetyltransferase